MNPITILKDATVAGINAATAEVSKALKVSAGSAGVAVLAEAVTDITGSHSATALLGVTVGLLAPIGVAFIEGFAASVAADTTKKPAPPAPRAS